MESHDEEWGKRALFILTNYYLNFFGTQFHEFNQKTDLELLLAKICFSTFGPPQVEADSIENCYSEEQKKTAEKILDQILKVYRKHCLPEHQLRIGFISVACKQEQNEFLMPLFTVCVGKNSSGEDMRNVVDLQCRVYKDWEDWKQNNKLPELKYCYPTRGFYTCSGGSDYKFDENQHPDVEFGMSPQSKLSSKVLAGADTVAAATYFVSGGIGIAAIFTPLAPFVLTALKITVGASGLYRVHRVIERLVDVSTHCENMTKRESYTLYSGLILTPLLFMSSVINGTPDTEATLNRTLNNSNVRLGATTLNREAPDVGGMLAFGLSNLYCKERNNNLQPLDVLQFSMSAFFFTNTLIQPKVASSIIAKAQNQHIDQDFNQMTDEGAKQAFKNFLVRSQLEETMTESSKIIRPINRIQVSNQFFTGDETNFRHWLMPQALSQTESTPPAVPETRSASQTTPQSGSMPENIPQETFLYQTVPATNTGHQIPDETGTTQQAAVQLDTVEQVVIQNGTNQQTNVNINITIMPIFLIYNNGPNNIQMYEQVHDTLSEPETEQQNVEILLETD